jgi:hypothetical protein
LSRQAAAGPLLVQVWRLVGRVEADVFKASHLSAWVRAPGAMRA